MATSSASLTSWKLKESVKFMRINDKGDNAQSQSLVPRLARSFGRNKDPPVKKQEIKVRHVRGYISNAPTGLCT